MRSLVIGCGALNWDIFFEVETIENLRFGEIKLEAGREYLLERRKFLEVYAELKKKAKLVFEGGGGSSANTIYCLAKLGFNTFFLGAVGKDEFGEKVLYELKEVGVETKGIKKGGTTSLALILLDKNKDRTILVSPGTAENFLTFEKDPFYPLGLYHFSSLASSSGQTYQMTLLQNLPQKISFDPGEIYTSKGKEFLKPFLEKTKYLFLTAKELFQSGYSKETLWERGIWALFLKKGKEGAEVYTKKTNIKSSVFPTKQIVDNTGAGDYFNAGVLAGLLLGLSLDKTLSLGLYMASKSLRDYGRRGLPSKAEFKKFLSRLK